MKQKSERSFYKGLPILALNWRQPYLNLMALGKIETRTWPTNFRGYVLMCGSKKAYSNHDVLCISGNYQFGRIMNCDPVQVNGKALFLAELVNCRPMAPADDDECYVQYKEPWTEIKERNQTYYDGLIDNVGMTIKTNVLVKKKLWCHEYKNVTAIEPIDFSADQGWRFVPPNILSMITPLQ